MNQISPEMWNKIDELFHQTIELPEEDQETFLINLVDRNSELADEVRQMVQAHRKSGAFLSGTVIDEINVQKGERIGPWEIGEQIGVGGMSTVFLAKRVDGQFERNVAIKFLHGLLPGRNMIERLHTEQNILAGLDHKNICKLMDAGLTDKGRPYFLMEYIDGISIDQYCSEQALSVEKILLLFEQVCEAVQYAHQRLIVHRDLKPSNILVNREGQVKLLDFGIAKLVKGDSELDITQTQTGLHLMTPEYASPEQINNETITTATDVYSLGLILCKLLTGQLPYDVKKKNPLEIGKIITENEPVKPSTLVKRSITDNHEISGNRWSEFRKSISGDLDNIILMALRKDPERRYRSTEQLLQDIRNYRRDLPVKARMESRGYLFRKFVKRHKLGVSAASFVVLVVLVAALISIHQSNIANEQRQIAEQRLVDVRDLIGSMMFDVHDAIINIPGSTPIREMIMEKTVSYLDRMSELAMNDPYFQLELAASYRKVGTLLGNPTGSNLGRPVDALGVLEKSLLLINNALLKDIDNHELLVEKADILQVRGDILSSMGRFEEAKIDQFQSSDIYNKLHERFPEGEHAFNNAILTLKIGDYMGNPNFANNGLPDSSLHYYREAKVVFQEYYDRSSTDIRAIRYMGLIHERLGTIYDNFDQDEVALSNFQQSMVFRKRFLELDPMNSNAMRDIAVAHEKTAKIYLKKNDLENAKNNFLESFNGFKWLAETDTSNVFAIQALATSHINLGDMAYHPNGNSFEDKDSARHHFYESKRLLTHVNKIDSTNTRAIHLMELVESRLLSIM